MFGSQGSHTTGRSWERQQARQCVRSHHTHSTTHISSFPPWLSPFQLQELPLSLSEKCKHTRTYTPHTHLHTIIKQTLSWIIKQQMLVLLIYAPWSDVYFLNLPYSARKRENEDEEGVRRWRTRLRGDEVSEGVLMWSWNAIRSLCRISLNGGAADALAPQGRKDGWWRWRRKTREANRRTPWRRRSMRTQGRTS